MRKLLTFLIALGAIALGACSPAGAWGCREFGRQGGTGCNSVIAGALSPVTLTFQSNGLGSTGANTLTFGTITIGAAPSANRRVIIPYASDSNVNVGPIVSAVFTPNSGSPINADTIKVAGTDGANFTSLYLVSAVLPVGTTTTLTITETGSPATPPRFAVYTVDNSTLSTPTNRTSSYGAFTTSPSTVTANLQAGGGLIAHFWAFGVSTESWTAGVTSDTGGLNFSSDFGHLSNTSATSGYAVPNTWTVSGSGNPDIALWVYR